jgi:hypothetical protein
MNRYESTTPRTAFGIAAIAMSVVTLGLAVVLPASYESKRLEAELAASSRVTVSPVREVAVIPSRVHVVADCDAMQAGSKT